MDRPKAVVASRQAMAEHRLEGLSHQTAFGRVQAGQPCLTDSFSSDLAQPFMKASCGKTARSVERRTEASPSMGASSDPTVRGRESRPHGEGRQWIQNAGRRWTYVRHGEYRVRPRHATQAASVECRRP